MKAIVMIPKIGSPLGAAAVAAAFALLSHGPMAPAASAQSLWTGVHEGPSIQVEMLRPEFSDAELGFVGATGAAFVTARVRLGERFMLVGDLPYARAAWEMSIDDGVSSMTGNPYLGVQWQTTPRLTTELGVRIPNNQIEDLEDLDILGAILAGTAGEVERMEAFTPETLGLYANASFVRRMADGFSVRARGGYALLTGEGSPEESVLGYTGQIWYSAERADLGAGVTGRWAITQDDPGVDVATHQAIVAGGLAFGRLRPGVQLRFPLDGAAKDLTGFTAGLSLGYNF